MRKSISSLSTVWLTGDIENIKKTINQDIFDKIITSFIELPRFDSNDLPDSTIEQFQTELLKNSVTSDKDIEILLNKYVAKEINAILNDPAILAARAKNLSRMEAKISFAETKGKSSSITFKELRAILNSAYIYLPFIEKISTKTEGGVSRFKIEGGIIWFETKIDASGNVSISKLATLYNTSSSIIPMNEEETLNPDIKSGSFILDNNSYAVTKPEEAQYSAIRNWAHMLNIKTKKLKQFNLTGKVIEVDRRKYSVNIGELEGIQLDDEYFLMEYEMEDGVEVSKRVGFLHIKNVADNTQNPFHYSTAIQRLGSTQAFGGWVQEHPRLGINGSARLGTRQLSGLDHTNMILDFSHLGSGTMPLFTKKPSTIYGASLNLSYNLAPLIEVSQLFILLDGFVGYFDSSSENTTPLYYNYNLGLGKKYWIKSMNLMFSAKYGEDNLAIIGTLPTTNDSFNYYFKSVNFVFATDYEWLFTHKWSFNVGLGYHLSSGFHKVNYSINGKSHTQTSDERKQYDGSNLSGVELSFGFSYAL